MKNILFLLLGMVFLGLAACADSDKDPLQFDKITKGAIITLRGQAFDNLSEAAFRGAVDSFSLSKDPAGETFQFDTDFLAEDEGSLSKVEIFASRTADGTRAAIATVNGTEFRTVPESNYPRASISIPLTTILTALNITLADLTPNSYLYISCDITLKDGTLVGASAISNGNLFESGLFYPAHNMRYIAKP
jgi:hypothetical protein